jgi:branched-chain amino acid transport system ATP-binding protein
MLEVVRPARLLRQEPHPARREPERQCQGEIVCLLGRNGVGRSTTIKAVMGQVVAKGSVRFKGRDIWGMKAYEIARKGIGLSCPRTATSFPT